MKIGVSKRGLWLLLVACLIFALAACSGQNEPSEAPDAARNPATDQAPSTSEESLSTEYPLTITDASGVELVFEQAPERIVSTSPAETEILFAIGLGEQNRSRFRFLQLSGGNAVKNESRWGDFTEYRSDHSRRTRSCRRRNFTEHGVG